ncbi:thioesterase [Prauserella sp. PE36]|uniref:Acyl-CoA thioesterase n=1 Tax=Prauserella endophytica TaxID=1592324 RepID=A0ABY2RTD4_9PSEU|nr:MULTISPECIES: acyl-CoA thioesterase [Prauserella]PXY17621.1 thioesterase [Prauserella coralliicola]RBM10884.1 thioesterase [Prauserella sp. PE36]TKG59877.1 acyl-CoA thioesterase [Prauserella endophytica]
MTEREPFRVQIKVRQYELDSLGHVNHAVYHQYAEVARTSLAEAAGAANGGLDAARLATVMLESHISFRRELRYGEVVDVTCEAKFGEGKTFRMDSNIYKADGTLSAEITCTLGLMDLDRRKLVAEPRKRFAEAGVDLNIFGG